ncbi:hypothetical protein P4H65_13255 [Paenibacillus chitinolyticus]|uniref:hypothetical protein n=1 Tax=Paenibacillus chitinolyticus TaxID=79263 RepID=UPI002DBBD4D9|nr:hypothetical protein [Paenibacillus chitinolyticus]MEC0246756.1 hypothetical protein [Paenibacillus chitinolyticus]
MVESQQHQQFIRHAVEAADAAILAAQEAEHELQGAITQADPNAIHRAQAKLDSAKRQVAEASAQIRSFDGDRYGQQLQQTIEQLQQAKQDLEVNEDHYHTPKQVR